MPFPEDEMLRWNAKTPRSTEPRGQPSCGTEEPGQCGQEFLQYRGLSSASVGINISCLVLRKSPIPTWPTMETEEVVKE